MDSSLCCTFNASGHVQFIWTHVDIHETCESVRLWRLNPTVNQGRLLSSMRTWIATVRTEQHIKRTMNVVVVEIHGSRFYISVCSLWHLWKNMFSETTCHGQGAQNHWPREPWERWRPAPSGLKEAEWLDSTVPLRFRRFGRLGLENEWVIGWKSVEHAQRQEYTPES